jgi:Zn-dependent peptidase ImmA (M78 family)
MGAIQPKVLTWARETAGLSMDAAAAALGLANARGRTKTERLARMEAGEEEPARPLLVKMAKTYRRPLLVFYLAAPPKQGDRGQDFRTLPAGHEQFNPELDALVRDIKARQGLIRSMLEDNQSGLVDFIGSATMEVPTPKLAALMADRLRFSLHRFRDMKNPDEAFAYLRETIEHVGVYVLLVGNLGSYHTNIPVDIFRGFALADNLAPLIVINDLDARTAWSFTAIHELAHLWLGMTGISGADTEQHIEQYCNDVAGEFLLPAAELQAFARTLTTPNLLTAAAEISHFAEVRHVSRAMIAYKLFRAGLIRRSQWVALDRQFRQEWEAHKEREAEKNKQAEGGPNYYVVRRHRVGAALLGLVRRSLDEGTTTYTKASRVLGVKPRSVEPLLSPRGTR